MQGRPAASGCYGERVLAGHDLLGAPHAEVTAAELIDLRTPGAEPDECDAVAAAQRAWPVAVAWAWAPAAVAAGRRRLLWHGSCVSAGYDSVDLPRRHSAERRNNPMV
jgi:hypothetical protein